MGFLKELDKALEEGKKNKDVNDSHKLLEISTLDKIKGVTGAIGRLKKAGIFNSKSYATKEQAVERMVCCTTCTDGTSCPYCGCPIRNKRLLRTENCPNEKTYPHLKKFPPKNYWQVTEEKTSVIIASRNEKYLKKTIQNLIETATGDIEFIVGIDGPPLDADFLAFAEKEEKIKVHIEEQPIGRRSISNKLIDLADGKYLFEADAHIFMKDHGWDTRLKCVCEDNMIVGCVMDALDENKWEPMGHKWLGCSLTPDLDWDWEKNVKPVNSWKKTEESLSFHAAAWMIRKETLEKIGRHKEFLGKYVLEEAEFTCDILCRGGKILIRTDVECAHLFRKNFPYPINDSVENSKRILNQLWNTSQNTNSQKISDIVEVFGRK